MLPVVVIVAGAAVVGASIGKAIEEWTKEEYEEKKRKIDETAENLDNAVETAWDDAEDAYDFKKLKKKKKAKTKLASAAFEEYLEAKRERDNCKKDIEKVSERINMLCRKQKKSSNSNTIRFLSREIEQLEDYLQNLLNTHKEIKKRKNEMLDKVRKLNKKVAELEEELEYY